MGVLIWILPSSKTSGKLVKTQNGPSAHRKLCPLPDTKVCFLIIRPTAKKKLEAKGLRNEKHPTPPPAASWTFETQTVACRTCCKKCLLLMMLSQNKTNVATDEEEWGDGQDEDNEMSQ